MCARGVEERNTMRTSGEIGAETKRPHKNKRTHHMQYLHTKDLELCVRINVLQAKDGDKIPVFTLICYLCPIYFS